MSFAGKSYVNIEHYLIKSSSIGQKIVETFNNDDFSVRNT